jgi:hypothetical protein
MVSRILLVTKNRGAYQGVGTFTTTATGEFPERPTPRFCSAIAGAVNADTAVATVAAVVNDLKPAMKVSFTKEPVWLPEDLDKGR